MKVGGNVFLIAEKLFHRAEEGMVAADQFKERHGFECECYVGDLKSAGFWLL